ncbi:MAG: YqaA family protein [Gemmatimonadaceae bacterium]
MTKRLPHPTPPIDSSTTSPQPVRGWRRFLDVYYALHRWAESGWSRSAVAGWGVLQGSVVPGPSDALLIPLGLADAKRVFSLALWATIGSVIGAHLAYLLGAHAFDSFAEPLFAWLGFSEARLASSRALFERRGWMLVALSATSPLSTKVICTAAGAFGVPLPEFTLAITVGRGVRFFAIATVLRFAGPWVQRWLESKAGRPPATASRVASQEFP